MNHDLINAAFECLGAGFIGLSIQDLHIRKQVAGVSPWHAGFFTAWGWWNLCYYPALGQWCSFAGGLLIVTLNTIWLLLLVRYARPSNERGMS